MIPVRDDGIVVGSVPVQLAELSHMDYEVIEARYVRDYVVWLRFRDGTCGEVDLEPQLYGKVFEPLRDVDTFQSFVIRFDTLAWPNDADFAPEFLHDQVAAARRASMA